MQHYVPTQLSSDLNTMTAALNAELAELDPPGRLYNNDLSPAKPNGLKCNGYSLFALWMNDAHNVGNYTFAAGLFIIGLSPIDVTLGVLIGALIIFAGCCMWGYIDRKSTSLNSSH